MTTTTLAIEGGILEQKRIDNRQWSNAVKTADHIGQTAVTKAKIPLFYLETFPIDGHSHDVYFVNNTDETLSFVAPYELMATDADLPGVTVPAKPSTCDAVLIYTQILPYQGVRIARWHGAYGSDYLNSLVIYTMSRGSKARWGVWRFEIVQQPVDKSYPLLWQDMSTPTGVVDVKKLADPKDRPILPLVLPIREALYQQWQAIYNHHHADLIVAVTDVIYRYDFGVIGCYYNDMWDEFSSEAEHIVEVLIREGAVSPEDVLAIMTTIYDAAFGKGVSKIPLVVAEQMYHLWLKHKREVV